MSALPGPPEGWRDITSIFDVGIHVDRRFVDAQGYARREIVAGDAPTEAECWDVIRRHAERIDARIVADGGTLVVGNRWPEGTLFEPVPEDIFG